MEDKIHILYKYIHMVASRVRDLKIEQAIPNHTEPNHTRLQDALLTLPSTLSGYQRAGGHIGNS
jgi:hypothetical protein